MLNIVLCSQQPAQLLWLDYSFGRANYSCRITTEWNVLLMVVHQSNVDAVLLDAAMGDAEERCRQLRATTDTPLTVINVEGLPDDYERLREAGADEAIAVWTPFNELRARMEKTLRRGELETI